MLRSSCIAALLFVGLSAIGVWGTPVRAEPFFRGLGDLPGGVFQSKARAISDDGSVVVGWSDSASGTEAFRWTAASGVQTLGWLEGYTDESWAFDASYGGSVIVGWIRDCR